MSRDKKALADTVFLEARDQGAEGLIDSFNFIKAGMDGVAHVVMNRARQDKDHYGGRNVADVCYKPKQFSCWDGRDKNLDLSRYSAEEQQVYKNIKKRTDAIYDGKGASDPTGGADHYHNPVKEPKNSWKDKCRRTKIIGDHDFYKC